MKSFKERYLYSSVFFVALLFIWEISTNLFSIPEYILPSPTAIISVLIELKSLFIKNFLVTLGEILSGFFIGAILGIILAIAIFSSRLLYNTLYPLLIAIQSIPKLALAPLFIIWFGFGIYPKIAITALVVLFPVLINAIKGLMSVEPELLDFMKSLNATKSQILLKIRIPYSVPYIFAGFKISITLAVVGAVIGEFVGADRGLGYIIMISSIDLNTERMFAALFLLSIMGLSLFGSISILERFILPWHINKE